VKPLPPTDESQLEAFDTVCRRLGGFDPRIDTEWADGYLTALLAGPRTVPPSQWLPAMCGDAFERAFADPDDVAQAMQALLGRWNVIARELDPESLLDDPEALRLRPLVLEPAGADVQPEDADADPLGARWADGFLQALADFAADWDAPLDDEAAAERDQALQAVRALVLPADELDAYLRAAYPGEAPDRDGLLDEACFAVQDLRTFWVDHAPRPAPLRVERRPGRNDPCPCGSGLKYKRCHGA